MDRETLQGLSSAHRTHRRLRNVDSGRNGPPQGRARAIGYPRPNTYKQHYRDKACYIYVFMNIYEHTHASINMYTTHENESIHEFKREQ